MDEPWGIGCSRDDKWAVTHLKNDFIHLYNSEDQLVRKINHQFYCPGGVTFDKDHLYVTDVRGVLKFTSDGDYLMEFDNMQVFGCDDRKMKYPKGLTVQKGKVYVADWGNRLILVFLTDGTFQQFIWKGQLGCPDDVAVTSNDELLMADSKHYCIYRFTLDGEYIGMFSNYGGESLSPMSITVDQNDFILARVNIIYS